MARRRGRAPARRVVVHVLAARRARTSRGWIRKQRAKPGRLSNPSPPCVSRSPRARLPGTTTRVSARPALSRQSRHRVSAPQPPAQLVIARRRTLVAATPRHSDTSAPSRAEAVEAMFGSRSATKTASTAHAPNALVKTRTAAARYKVFSMTTRARRRSAESRARARRAACSGVATPCEGCRRAFASTDGVAREAGGAHSRVGHLGSVLERGERPRTPPVHRGSVPPSGTSDAAAGGMGRGIARHHRGSRRRRRPSVMRRARGRVQCLSSAAWWPSAPRRWEPRCRTLRNSAADDVLGTLVAVYFRALPRASSRW